MTTLIEVRDKDGRLIRSCDARCYNAKGPKCRCVCDSVNHGVGLSEAKAWTRLCSTYLKEQAPAGHTIKLYQPPTRFKGEQPRKEVIDNAKPNTIIKG